MDIKDPIFSKKQEYTVKEIQIKKAFKEHEDFNIMEDFSYPYHLIPYQGCAFQCVYCFNYKNPKYWKNIEDKKSEIVVATNIIDLVKQELQEITNNPKLPLVLRIGTEAEVYGPAEEKYNLTRQILQEFVKYPQWHIRIPTKSDLILRDIDILKQLDCLVTFTLSTTDEGYASKLELNAPSVKRRIDAMSKLRKNNIKCRIRCEPYLEGITDIGNMLKIKQELKLEEIKIKPLNYFSEDEVLREAGLR